MGCRRSMLLALALGLPACSSQSPAGDAPTAPADGGAEALPDTAASGITIDLQDATVADVARALAGITGKPVVVAADAQELADCARATLTSLSPIQPAAAPALVREALAGSGTVLEDAEEGWVVRRGGGEPPARCRPPSAATADAGAPADAESSAEAPALSDAELRRGIRVKSEGEVELTARVWDALGTMPLDVPARWARFVPEVEGGRTVGLRLFGIRQTSPLAALGLRNGDAVLAIDGQPIAGPQDLLAARTRGRGHTQAIVTVQRAGARLDVHYRRRER